MANTEKYVVEGIRKGNGVPSSGGFRDPDTGRLISQYTNPRPYHEPVHSPSIASDYERLMQNQIKAQAWGLAFEVASDIWNMPEVRRVRQSVFEYVILEFDSWLWRKHEEKEAKRALESRSTVANYREVQPKEPKGVDNALVADVERLKREGKIVEFPSKKVI